MANRQTKTVTFTTGGNNLTVDLEDPATNGGLLPERRLGQIGNNSLPTPIPVAFVITNDSNAVGYLATDDDLPDPGGAPGNDEADPTTTIIFEARAVGVVVGPYAWPGLPKLRLLANCTLIVTAIIDVKGA